MRLFPVSMGCKARGREGLTKHGSPTRQTYNIWINMMHRCYDKKRKSYELYGGRGIIVCKHWHDFKNFLNDIGKCPGKGWSIDRINNNGNYEPGNCRWVTQKEQTRNTSRNRLLTFNGKTQCVAAWADEFGVKDQLINDRINKLGWPPELALRLANVKGKRALASALSEWRSNRR